MATTDVFNNPANNYVNPALTPCAGAGDDSYLEFLPNDQIGIVQGQNILASISFSDIKIPVSGYSTQKKILDPGEVTFVAGLTKGLNYRSQSFTLPLFTTNDLNPYFMVVDLSIGFYKNFKHYSFNVEASANYANNVSIDQALDIALSNIQAKMTTTYDPSDLTFTGTQLGWDFNISNLVLTVIDASENILSPFPSPAYSEKLDEDLTKMVLYAKYPNSAMQGVVLKATYPAVESPYNKWFQVNHVTDVVTIYEPVKVDNFIKSLQYFITFDPSIYFKPLITDFSGAVYNLDLSINAGSYPLGVVDSSFANYDLIDSSIYNSQLNLDSSISNSFIEYSWVNKKYPELPYGNPSSRVRIYSSLIKDCSISNAIIKDSSIFRSSLQDVSLYNCTLYNCSYEPISNLVYSNINCVIFRINEKIDPSLAYDSSTYYQPVIKTIEVGMSGCSSQTAMSGGDYLEWITENQDWKKVGDLYIWTAAPDADDTRNLIDGFYAFNPQEFPIQIEYLIFV